MELTGSERSLALLESERGVLFAAGTLFVSGGTFLSVLMYAGLLMATFGTRTLLEMAGVAILWSGLMLGLWAGVVGYLAWTRRWLLKRRVLLPAAAARDQNRKLRLGTLAGLAAFLTIGPLSLLLSTGQWDRAPATVLMFMPAIGYVLICLGLFGFRGHEPRCVTCAYDVGDAPGAWHTCPECGRDLAEPFGVVLGDRTRRWRLVGLGLVVVWAAHLGVVLL